MRSFVSRMWTDMVLGMLFTVSGFVKAVDPMGLAYKLEEYLALFGLAEWNRCSGWMAVGLCAAELTLGLLLLLRLWRRTTAVAVTIFLLVFTALTYRIYSDPYGGIQECGCFGEAFHLSNGATFAKNVLFLIVAGVHVWRVFRQGDCLFDWRRTALGIGCAVVAALLPVYARVYLPPFDFLPYNVGTKIEGEHGIALYDSAFREVTKEVFDGEKMSYMIGVREEPDAAVEEKVKALREAWRNGVIRLFVATSQSGMPIPGGEDVPQYFMDDLTLKSVLRCDAGVVAFSRDRRIIGKWNLEHTPRSFHTYGGELGAERWKRTGLLGGMAVVVLLFFRMRKKMGA